MKMSVLILKELKLSSLKKKFTLAFFCLFWSFFWANQNKHHIFWKQFGIRRFRIRCLMSWARYRLHQENGRAWCAAKRAVNEWVLVDLGVASKVSGIVTQGRGDISEWVTHFMVSYSLDAYKWEFARDIYGTKKVQAVLSLIIANLLSR